MIRQIGSAFQFLKKEKFYSFLFLAVIVFYTSMQFWHGETAKEASKPAPAVEAFKHAEVRLQNRIQKAGSMNEYLKAHPKFEAVFTLLSILIGFGLTAGLIIDFLILFKPGWRARFAYEPKPPPSVDWKFSMIFKVVLLFIAGSTLLGGILSGSKRFLGGGAGDMNFYMLFHTFLIDFLSFAFVLHVVRAEGGSQRDIGLQVPSGSVPRELIIAWGAYAAILPLFVLSLVGLIALAQLFHYEPEAHPLVNIFLEEEHRSSFLIYFSIFLAVAFGPVFEEIFFRGFCYQILKRHWGIFPAMVASAAGFALIHANTFAFWPIFILGMALAWVFEKRGSLLPGIILHVTHNAVFITYFFLAKKLVQQAGG